MEKNKEKRLKSWKKAGIAIIIAGVLVGFGCHFRELPDEQIIGVIPQYNSSEFQRIEPGLEKAAEDQGYKVVTKIPAEMTVQAQRKAMSELVEEGADCILIEAVAEGGFQDVLDECSSNKIPVLTYNSRVNSQDIYLEVLPYSIESVAEKILSAMAKENDGSGQFGVLSTTSQDYLREARTREMLKMLENGSYPELRFTGSGFVKEDSTLVAEKAAQLEKKYPDLEYMVCYSTLDAREISSYVEENKNGWKLICEASLDEFASAAPEGTIVLTYDYYRYGRFLAQLAVDAVGSDNIPSTGESFKWDSDREYVFTRKWGWNSAEDEENSEIPEFCCITMQNAPDIMVRKNGQWE